MARGAGEKLTNVTSMSVGSSLMKNRSASRSWRSASVWTGPLSTSSCSLTGHSIASNFVVLHSAPSVWMATSSALRSVMGLPSPSTALMKTWIACWARSGEAPAMTSASSRAAAQAKGNRARLPLIRQREDVNLIVPPCRRNAGLSNQSACQQPLAAHHRDVLLAVDRVRDCAVVDRPAQRRLPEDLAAGRVECPKFAVEVAPEDDAAGRGEHGAIARGASFIYVLNLAGLHIDFGEAAEFLGLRPRARDSASLFVDRRLAVRGRNRRRHVEAVVHPRHEQGVLTPIVGRGPVAPRVPVADHVVLARRGEHEVFVDRDLARSAVDVRDEKV